MEICKIGCSHQWIKALHVFSLKLNIFLKLVLILSNLIPGNPFQKSATILMITPPCSPIHWLYTRKTPKKFNLIYWTWALATKQSNLIFVIYNLIGPIKNFEKSREFEIKIELVWNSKSFQYLYDILDMAACHIYQNLIFHISLFLSLSLLKSNSTHKMVYMYSKTRL